jgi:hypothetical protein
MRQQCLSNRVFNGYDTVIDAACEACQKSLAVAETIISIRMRDRAHIGQSQ